jgi:hypothetical protein
MSDKMIAGTTDLERLTDARRLAGEAGQMRDAVFNPDLRRIFISQNRQWNEFADQLESAL